jgi:hypothetical protein
MEGIFGQELLLTKCRPVTSFQTLGRHLSSTRKYQGQGCHWRNNLPMGCLF